ncbi:MAG: 30S ribosomal protein S3 [Candidatus Pacebacteria bacterium]|nr:30S ribosomal protein S3 [Candidatus Paceibacterota bacterium]
MGQKVNPIGFRLPVTKDWRSRWFAHKSDFGNMLLEDLRVRDFIKKELEHAAVSRIDVERFANRIRVTVYSARPGLVIGRKGAEIDRLKEAVSGQVGGKEVFLDIKEVKQPELNAQLVAENISQQLERRVSFRRAMKRSIQTAMDLGAEGIRVRCAGRLGGAELARTEQYKDGKVPLHTLRETIDFGFAEAQTLAGTIGVKVWICRKQETEGE